MNGSTMKRSARFTVGRCRRRPEAEVKLAEKFALTGEELRGVYALGSCNVILAWSQLTGWHLSISHPSRYPTWDEIAEARYQLIPDDVTVGMVLPPSDEYVNAHPNCFHLHEIVEKIAKPSIIEVVPS